MPSRSCGRRPRSGALTGPGDTLLVESPTYLGALAAARAAGLRVVPVLADADGVRPDHLAAAFARTGARLFYCQPLYANPHGGTPVAGPWWPRPSGTPGRS